MNTCRFCKKELDEEDRETGFECNSCWVKIIWPKLNKAKYEFRINKHYNSNNYSIRISKRYAEGYGHASSTENINEIYRTIHQMLVGWRTHHESGTKYFQLTEKNIYLDSNIPEINLKYILDLNKQICKEFEVAK